MLPTLEAGGWFEPNRLMLLTPSAFFILALIVWWIRERRPAQREQTDADAGAEAASGADTRAIRTG